MAQSAQAALTITSNGADMSDSLLAAVRTHDTVILDGSAGEFILGHTVVLKHLQNKTIKGTHDACLRTRFRLTKDIRAMLDSADVMSFSTAGEGGVLSNGQKVREQRELKTRQLFIDRFNDPEESFRASGCIQLSHCRAVLRFGNMLKIDNIRRMNSEKAFIRAYAFKSLDRPAALIDRAVFAIDIIVVFVVFLVVRY